MQITQKITPYLSFNNEAEEAARFYVSVFPDSEVIRTVKQPETGAVMTVEFRLAGLNFAALNVGETWSFTHAISLSVRCDSQEEVDDLWAKLTDGGEEIHCGWLKDRYGVSWQIVPSVLGRLIGEGTPEQTQRVMGALMSMIKLDIAALQRAYDGAA